MNFRQFAFNNVRRNLRAYSSYLLNSAFSVMIFFVYASFLFHPDLMKSEVGKMTKFGMTAAEIVIFAFAFLFVLYSISSFLKARSHEFGMLTLLGIESKQLNRLILLENGIIGSIAILIGSVAGLLFSKLFFLIAAYVIEMPELPFYIPWKAFGITTIAFMSLFLGLSLLTFIFVRMNQVLELIQGRNKPKKEPRVSVILALLSVAGFGYAYYLFLQPFSNQSLLLILLSAMIGTYFFFTQITVLCIRWLQNRRSFFWRGSNMLWVSDLAYKLKDLSRILFMVTFLITIACSAIGVLLGKQQQNEEVYHSQFFALTYVMYQGPEEESQEYRDQIQQSQEHQEQINQILEKNKISYQRFELNQAFLTLLEANYPFYFIKESEYNQLAKVLNLPQVDLNLNQMTFVHSTYTSEGSKIQANKSYTTEDNKTLNIVQRIDQSKIDRLNGFVVDDHTYNQLVHKKTNTQKITYYHIPAWTQDHGPSASSQEVQIGKQVTDKKNQNPRGILFSRGIEYISTKQTSYMFFFIASFISAIFSLSTASFLYFKLHTDLQQDRQVYHMLSKVGISRKEMRRSATNQLVVLFFTPIIFATAGTWIGLDVLQEQQISFTITPTHIMTAVISFALAQFVYFILIRSRYLKQIERAMV